MAKNLSRRSASSASSNKRPQPRKPPAKSQAKIRKLPSANQDKKPTMRSAPIEERPQKKPLLSRFKKEPKGRHSIPLDPGSAASARSPYASSGPVSPRNSSGVRMESRTIAQINQERDRQIAAEERRKRSKKRAKKAKVPFIIGGALATLAIALVGAYFVLSNNGTFKIEAIDITGTDHLTNQEVSALVSVPQGTTLLSLDSDAIVSSLKRDAWVDSVDVNKQFPNKLEIVVHERSITAVAEIPMGENQEIQKWAISEDGHWLMAIPDRDTELGSQISEQIHADAESVLHISGLEYGISPEIGAQCTDPEILNALEIISNMTTSLEGQVKSVSAPDVDSTMLVLNNNVEIAFGAAEDIRDKERICLQIMKDNPKVVYINIRVLDRPTWRSA